MPNITAPALSFPSKSFPTQQAGAPSGVVGEMLYTEVMGRYATLAKSQKLFYASAQITAPVIYSTAIQAGPMIWNRPASGLDAHILAILVSQPSTAYTVAGSIGWAANLQPTAPTSPTALTALNCYAGGPASGMGAVNTVGTVLVLPLPTFMPLIAVNTGAISVTAIATSWMDVGAGLIVGPGTVGYVCGSATLSTGVAFITIVWAEVPA
jgi:hypothetical protein